VLRLCAALTLLLACGDGNEDSPTAPATEARRELIEMIRAMGPYVGEIEIQRILTEEGQMVAGVSGTLLMQATQWVFNSFSPDGEIVIEGTLRIGIIVSPWTIRGQLETSARVVMVVDLTLDLSDLEKPRLAGQLRYKGHRFEVEELLTEASIMPEVGDS
jgi:hypothetical protein